MNCLKSLSLFTLLLFITGTFGCQGSRLKLVNKYKYFEATIDDIPPVNKIEAITVLNYYHPEIAQITLLVGNQKNTEKILSHEINPQKVVDDRKWIEKLTADFKNAKQCYTFKYRTAADYGRGVIENSHVVFITNDKAYMIPIDINDEFAYGPNYQSKELKKDFDELRLD